MLWYKAMSQPLVGLSCLCLSVVCQPSTVWCWLHLAGGTGHAATDSGRAWYPLTGARCMGARHAQAQPKHNHTNSAQSGGQYVCVI